MADRHTHLATTSPDIDAEGYAHAVALLHDCRTDNGFVASSSEHQNYHRIWSRDGVIIALAALLTGKHGLTATVRRTLETLAEYQGPHGEIPSNVDIVAKQASYGGNAGRVDADLWFIIGCGEYWLATDDHEFLDAMLPVIEKVHFLLGAWEFNNRGFIYVPLTGDWADEYLHNGYVLYDQLLYLQAQRTLARMHAAMHDASELLLRERISHLRDLIRANFWFDGDGNGNGDGDGDGVPTKDIYHEVLYRKGLQAADNCAHHHWLPAFSPSGYSYRFDAFANVLASLFDVADNAQRRSVDHFITREIVNVELPLLPAFHPVIKPVDENWKHLQVMFSYTFKNKPYEYHNGGLWPIITGFYVADLARRQQTQAARRYLQAVHRANAMEMNGEPWGFPEYVQGRELTPGGTRHQGWSAAAAIIGQHALEGQPLFRIDSHDD